MAQALFSHYRQQNLKELIDHLKTDYYDAIAANCINISKLTDALQNEDHARPEQLYISLCIKLVNEIKHSIHMCEVIVVPYIYELHEKKETNHDCGNCSGNCHMHHSLQLKGIRAAHEKVKEMLAHIAETSRSLEKIKQKPSAACQVLRNEIACLDTILTELFYLEEALLIPGIVAAQTRIHAVS